MFCRLACAAALMVPMSAIATVITYEPSTTLGTTQQAYSLVFTITNSGTQAITVTDFGVLFRSAGKGGPVTVYDLAGGITGTSTSASSTYWTQIGTSDLSSTSVTKFGIFDLGLSLSVVIAAGSSETFLISETQAGNDKEFAYATNQGGEGTLLTTSSDGVKLISGYAFGSGFGSTVVPIAAFEGTVNYSVNPTPAPEPASMVVLMSGIIGLGAARRRKIG